MTTSLFTPFPANTFKFVRFATRSVSDGVLNSSTTVTSATANFTTADVGAAITATGIPAADTIATRSSATQILLAVAATATASGVTLTIVQTTTNAVATMATELAAAFTGVGLQVFADGNVSGNALVVVGGAPPVSVAPGSWFGLNKNNNWATLTDAQMHGGSGAFYTDYFLT